MERARRKGVRYIVLGEALGLNLEKGWKEILR